MDGTIRVWKQITNNLTNTTGSTLRRAESSNALSWSRTVVNPIINEGSNPFSISGEPGELESVEEVVPEWECEHTVVSDGPVYALCCLSDGKVVSAGASNKISIWKSAVEREHTAEEDWVLHKQFETEEDGVWSLTICRGRLISGGVDGTVRVWT